MEHAIVQQIQSTFVYTSETKDEDIIPSKLIQLVVVDSSVREIPAEAFRRCKASLVHVQLPETLRRIGKDAFYSCSNLKSVQFISSSDGGASLNKISSRSNHHDPTNLEDGTIVFPEWAELEIIEEGSFCCCKSLRKLSICPASTKLGEGAFSNCCLLSSVEFLPERLQVIEPYLFAYCESLTTVKIPSSVIRIGDSAFYRCRNLTCFELPQGLLDIETLHIPSTVSSIGACAFLGCSGLEHVTLPPNLERIEFDMFNGCGSLKYVNIPSTVSFIGECAFYKCDSLSHLRIPPRVGSIVTNAFARCRNLISVELPERILIGCGDYEDTEDDEPDDEGSFDLVNLAMPTLPEDDEVVSFLLYNKSKLGSVVDNEAGLYYKLKHRFDNAPLNKLCYYQSYQSSEAAMMQLRRLMEQDDPLAATNHTDEFGMTPLHVLALSQTPNLDMLLALMNEGNADHLVHSRDSFGSTPLDYLCLTRMPNSTQVIRRVLYTRFDYLLGLNRCWNSDMLHAIDAALAVDFSSRKREIVAIYLKLANYELKVVFSLLERRLWKSGGTSVVLANVLLFLDTLDVNICFEDSP